MENVENRPTAKPYQEILAYQHERLVQRHARDAGVQVHVAERLFRGLKEFLIVCATKRGAKISSAEIDSIWHTFLLYTRDYRTFCEEYLGRFINHQPFERANPAAYGETRHSAEQIFGPLDPSVWPLQGKADCTSGCDD